MKAVVTTGSGGYDKLLHKEVPVPKIGPGEVLIQVLAAGVNNTDINTRIGWYSTSVTEATDHTSNVEDGRDGTKADGGWNGPTPFPYIQGVDCCGIVVEIAKGVSPELTGKRVLVQPCIRTNGYDDLDHIWLGIDRDGAFAQYMKVQASEVFPVDCDWSDAELGSIPCAYGTAENMLHRANLQTGERVLITGASGGVASAAVQLAKRRGAHVMAVTSKDKQDQIRAIGADQVFDRGDDLIELLGEQTINLVIDNVAGAGFPSLLKLLMRGGRYISSGAIAGPIVDLDMRDLYLKDLTMMGSTAWDKTIFPNLVSYIKRGELKPLVSKTYPLSQIAEAQQDFLKKEYVGKLVLIP